MSSTAVWTLGEIAEVTGGEVHDAAADLVVPGPAFIDTRTPEIGGLFAAFDGERVDGHTFAAAAVEAGAAAVLGSRPTGLPSVVVRDVRAALQALATAHLATLREQGALRSVLAITGSQGKTSVKDLLREVLAGHAPTMATAGAAMVFL